MKTFEDWGHTNSNWVVHIFHFDNIPQQYTTFLFILAKVVVLIFIEHNTRRVNDPNAAFKLNGLQFLCMTRLSSNGTNLQCDTILKRNNTRMEYAHLAPLH